MPLLENKALVVFDLDGTLADTFGDIAAAAQHALREMQRPVPEADAIIRHVGNGGRRLMADCLGPDASSEEADRAFELWAEYYRQHPAEQARPYPGVLDTLGELRLRGVQTALLSNKLHELVLPIVKQTGLAPLLDAVQGEEPGLPRKPDPTTLLRLIERQGTVPGHTMMVGDGDADIRVALNAGATPVGVAWGLHPVEKLRALGAEHVLASIDELLA